MDLNEFAATLRGVTAKVRRQAIVATQATGAEAVGVMRTEAPVDTGALRNSIRNQPGAGGLEANVGPSVNYAPFVAYGTRRMAPNPFDLRTAQTMGPRFAKRMEELGGDVL
jgi:HK97 gp10 family phage protein